MGQNISRSAFTPEEHQQFELKLHDNLAALQQAMQRPGFGTDQPSLGVELELYILDAQGLPLGINQALLAEAVDPALTLELNRYNIEYNLPVLALDGAPFSWLETLMCDKIARMNGLLAPREASVLGVGILPTLNESHIGPEMMTPTTRYQALSEILLAMRGRDFEIRIDGEDPVRMRRQDVTLEGVCTSFQVHFNFPLTQFMNTWNAVTLITPLLLGAACNSPLLLGRRLWHETRVPLFKQSTDGRSTAPQWHDLPRVELGYDWLRQSAYELFAQRVYLYPSLIPLLHDENPQQVIADGHLPGLHELNMHNGTIWHWNRPIYSGADNGHIRIEMRCLPAGPTPLDMAANAAFYIGLAAGLRDDIEALLPAMPFRFVSDNFYRAARTGIHAKLVWPTLGQNRLAERPLREIGESLLDTALAGLLSLGVDAAEARRMLDIIANRLIRGQNGATWQLDSLEHLAPKVGRDQALHRIVSAYQGYFNDNLPVADWELAQ